MPPLTGDPAWRGHGFVLHRLAALGSNANYIYVLEHAASRDALVVDPGEAAPVEALLHSRELKLRAIWLTHHHWDHIDGVADLVAIHRPQVTGHAADAARLPPLGHATQPGGQVRFHDAVFDVIETPGHTRGHVAYHSPRLGLLFSGDTIFSLGCGRLLEGTPAEMFATLGRLAGLPDDTLVCAAHEYSEANAAFAYQAEPDHALLAERRREIVALRAAGAATVPVRLGDEKAANPFLRAEDIAAFAALRAARDRF